jgi:hypothetical protein
MFIVKIWKSFVVDYTVPKEIFYASLVGLFDV